MDFLLYLMIVFLFIGFVLMDNRVDKENKRLKKQCNSLKKQCNRLRFEVMKLQDNEFYIFDYISSMYEDIERGSNEERKESE